MPDKTACAHCHHVGLVRREHVIRAGQAAIVYYCGNCDGSWTVAEEDARRPAASPSHEKPDRSR